MGADLVVLYYGVRFTLKDGDEDLMVQLESETYPVIPAAKSAGLNTWWGYSDANGNIHLLIGRQLAMLSAERLDPGWTGYAAMRDSQMRLIVEDVRTRLRLLGISDEPLLHAQLEPDM